MVEFYRVNEIGAILLGGFVGAIVGWIFSLFGLTAMLVSPFLTTFIFD